MKFILTLFILSVLLSMVWAADAVESTGNCIIKGGTRSWDYNPYSGKGPKQWGDLDVKNAACKTGTMQSPINFPKTVKYDKLSTGLTPSIGSPKLKFMTTSKNFALNCPTSGQCGHSTVNGKRYNLVNIHFHTPSEHILNGRYHPLEAHVVHASADGDYAVLATMFKYPKQSDYGSVIYKRTNKQWGVNEFLQSIIENIYADRTEFVVPIEAILKPTKGYCSYTGSLTTPPCTEGVKFFMSMHVPTITRRQVHAMALAAGGGYDGTSRPLQAINKREITCHIL